MNTRKLTLLFTALVGLAVSAFAQTKTTEATVSQLTGSATVTLPDGTTTALAPGAKVPQGATITTAADGEVYLQTHTNTVATIKANSTVSVDELSVTTSGGKVTEEKTTLNLKSGNLISALDPAKRNVNNFAVRTPKGVAAARGTTFTVTVNGQNYSIITTSGSVQITNLATGLVVTIAGGQASVSTVADGAATAVADLPAAEKSEAVAAMAVAVGTIAVAADKGMLGANGAAEVQAAATTVLTAAPEAAASIAATVASVAPSQNAAITSAAQTVATTTGNTSLTTTVQQTQQSTPPASSTPTSSPSPNQNPTQQPAETPATTPQPIDVSTVSRSGE